MASEKQKALANFLSKLKEVLGESWSWYRSCTIMLLRGAGNFVIHQTEIENLIRGKAQALSLHNYLSGWTTEQSNQRQPLTFEQKRREIRSISLEGQENNDVQEYKRLSFSWELTVVAQLLTGDSSWIRNELLTQLQADAEAEVDPMYDQLFKAAET